MALPPLKTAISDTYPNPSNATARAGFAALYDYVTSFPFGQCRLVKSGANIVLQRFNGLWITINDKANVIPAAGVSLAATGLTPNTTYYIYAWMNGATMTLEASTTGHSADTNTGVEIKTGDASRTLVGMARPGVGPAWVDVAANRHVISWFNPRPLRLYVVQSSVLTSTTSAIAPLTSALTFLTWGDGIPASFIAAVSNNTANALCYSGLGLDSTTVYSHIAAQYQAYTATANGKLSGGSTFAPAEGFHYLSLNYSVGAGTGSWAAGAEASAVIMG
jgi:hypothetical protein